MFEAPRGDIALFVLHGWLWQHSGNLASLIYMSLIHFHGNGMIGLEQGRAKQQKAANSFRPPREISADTRPTGTANGQPAEEWKRKERRTESTRRLPAQLRAERFDVGVGNRHLKFNRMEE